jgi:predicted nucleic acid-binding protein
MDLPKNLYWDSCVFIAHLADDKEAYADYLEDIGQFLREAQKGDLTIHCSTITIAEITKANLRSSLNYEDFQKLWGAGIVPVTPDVNMMKTASELRSLVYTKTGGERKLSTPDAIHLASALGLQETYGVKIDAFHTFDMGKSRDHDGKGVPMIGFEDWCEKCKDDPLAKKVVDLTRCKPEHPNKGLDV